MLSLRPLDIVSSYKSYFIEPQTKWEMICFSLFLWVLIPFGVPQYFLVIGEGPQLSEGVPQPDVVVNTPLTQWLLAEGGRKEETFGAAFRPLISNEMPSAEKH